MQVNGNCSMNTVLFHIICFFFCLGQVCFYPHNPCFAHTRPCFFFFYCRVCRVIYSLFTSTPDFHLGFKCTWRHVRDLASLPATAEYISMRYKMVAGRVWAHFWLFTQVMWCVRDGVFFTDPAVPVRRFSGAFWPRCLPLARTAEERASYYPFAASATAICQVAVELLLTPAERPFNLGGVRASYFLSLQGVCV